MPGIDRATLLERFQARAARGEPIIGGGAGTGLSAKSEAAGGIDLIVIYNSGRYRMAGRGSLAGLLLMIGVYRGGLTPFVFSPRLDWEFVYAYIEYPKGTPPEIVVKATERLDAAFREVEREHLRPDGRTLVFVLLANNYTAPSYRIEEAIDAIVEALTTTQVG